MEHLGPHSWSGIQALENCLGLGKDFPSEENLSNALSRIGHTHLSLDKTSKKIRILKPGVLLDLGGIAKGYTADRMLETIQGFGIKRCLIDAGRRFSQWTSPKR